MSALALSEGFSDPVIDGQATFRAVMDALARPGSVQSLDVQITPPAPLTAELAAIALALVDHETTLWLDAPLAGSSAVTGYLRFHTGVRIVSDPSEAAFALVTDGAGMPRLEDFAIGTDEYPDRSTTVVIAVEGLAPAGLSPPVIPAKAGTHIPEASQQLFEQAADPSSPRRMGPGLRRDDGRGGGDGLNHDEYEKELTLIGPGIETISRLIVSPWLTDLTTQLAANRALFPRGVDLIFAADGAIAALPRTTTVSEG